MELIETLYEEAHQNGVTVRQGEIPVPHMDAAYLRTGHRAMIWIRQDGTQAERACWLAEELGHHNMSCGQVLRYDKVQDWKAEARARKWAHDRLLSRDAILCAAENTDDIYEIAYALNVSVPFLREAIDDYKARGLWAL